MTSGFLGRHNCTGTVVNTLAAMGVNDPKTGKPYTEALAFGASGGIAFGYFVFEYKGHLPHVALLTRNTFSPFERTMDNLAIRREARETTDGARAERNLRLELDAGNPVIVLADAYSLPYTGLCAEQMWAMRPLLVVGQEGTDFLVVDGPEFPIKISAEDLHRARAKVKKDRFRMVVLEAPDTERLAEGLLNGIKTCNALFLDKPPAGSPNNFGFIGMRHWAKMLTDTKNAKGWVKTFEPGPRLVEALAGHFGQPGLADWIERWGTDRRADRGAFADFLEEASVWMGKKGVAAQAAPFRKSAELWNQIAEASLPDDVPELKALKELKRRHVDIFRAKGLASLEERAAIREQMKELTSSAGVAAVLSDHAVGIQARISELVVQIVDIEEPAIQSLRESL